MTATKDKSSKRAGGHERSASQGFRAARSKRAADQRMNDPQIVSVSRSSSPSNENGTNPTNRKPRSRKASSGSANGSQATTDLARPTPPTSPASDFNLITDLHAYIIEHGQGLENWEVAQAYVAQLAPTLYRDALTQSLGRMMTPLLTKMRTSIQRPTSNRSGKYENAREAHESGELDAWRRIIHLPRKRADGTVGLYGHFTLDDIECLIARADVNIRGLERDKNRQLKIRDRMRAKKVARVQDLPSEFLLEVWSDE